MTYARKTWTAEKEAWKAVIQLNLIRAANTIIDAVTQELDAADDDDLPDDDAASFIYPRRKLGPQSELVDPDGVGRPATAMSMLGGGVTLTDKQRALVERLAPLRFAQAELESRLGSGAEEEDQPAGSGHTSAFKDSVDASQQNPFEDVSLTASSPTQMQAQEEFFVRSSGWKGALQRLKPKGTNRASMDGGDVGADGITRTLARLSGDIQALWHDPVVREVMRARKVRLMDCSDLYVPSSQHAVSY